MTVKDLAILVEKMKQNSDEKDILIKTLETQVESSKMGPGNVFTFNQEGSGV